MVFICTEKNTENEICNILKKYGVSVIKNNSAVINGNCFAVAVKKIGLIRGNAMIILDNTCIAAKIENDVTVAADCDSKTVVSLLKKSGCVTVSLGSSPINSISVSSMGDNYALISVQRTFLTKSKKSVPLGEYRINTEKKLSPFVLTAIAAALLFEEIL